MTIIDPSAVKLPAAEQVTQPAAILPYRQIPEAKTVDPRTPYYFDAVKIPGTGNSTGLFGALVAFYYFAKQESTVLLWIKIAAAFYLAGVCLFTVAFFSLYKFSVWQLSPASRLPHPWNVDSSAESRVERWRTAALTAGACSLIVWWVGTAAAVEVLYLLSRTPL